MAAPALIAAAAWTALVLATNPNPGTSVILLPQDDGKPTAVTVRSKGGEQTVTQPFQRATAFDGSQSAPSLDQTDPAAVQAEHKALFELRPPKPHIFNLLFDTGGTSLTPASVKALDSVIADARARPGADITVTGYTDTRGSASGNDALSMRRAQEVKQLLVGRGFASDHIEAVGRGERELAIPTGDNVDEPRNRRVVIVVR